MVCIFQRTHSVTGKMNVVEGLKETLPRAIELVRLLFNAIFVEADTSAETEEPVSRGTRNTIFHYTVLYFVCAWALRLVILRPIAKLSLSVSGDSRKLEKRTDKSVQSFLEAIESMDYFRTWGTQ